MRTEKYVFKKRVFEHSAFIRLLTSAPCSALRDVKSLLVLSRLLTDEFFVLVNRKRRSDCKYQKCVPFSIQ